MLMCSELQSLLNLTTAPMGKNSTFSVLLYLQYVVGFTGYAQPLPTAFSAPQSGTHSIWHPRLFIIRARPKSWIHGIHGYHEFWRLPWISAFVMIFHTRCTFVTKSVNFWRSTLQIVNKTNALINNRIIRAYCFSFGAVTLFIFIYWLMPRQESTCDMTCTNDVTRVCWLAVSSITMIFL